MIVRHNFLLQCDYPCGTAPEEMIHTQCGGKNMSPPLHWLHAPQGTKSFAVTMHDGDAPTGSGFWHWVVFDIPNEVASLTEGAGSAIQASMPQGALQAKNDTGLYGYTGPNPPKGHGWHTYLITVYALDLEQLGLTRDDPPALIGFYLWMHTLAKASIVFYYRSI